MIPSEHEYPDPPTPKPWYASQTIWAGLLVFGVNALAAVGVAVDPTLADTAAGAIVAAVNAGLGLWAIIGRVRATARIGTRTTRPVISVSSK